MHPYKNAETRQIWNKAVTGRHVSELGELHTPKFQIEATWKIATAGSCFAQHIKRFLEKAGVETFNVEPAPAVLAEGAGEYDPSKFGYDLFSARYGNIYTAAQLKQLILQSRKPNEEMPDHAIWERDGRFFDAFRPGVEPFGLKTRAEVRAQRAHHLRVLLRLWKRTDLFVFTLGLTEAWGHRASGDVYPIAPGVIAGRYDPEIHEFRNFDVGSVVADLEFSILQLRKRNPDMKFLFTVSPVPLAATYEPQHVLVSTSYSKSVLRAAAGMLQRKYDFVDYFPSYEIVTGPNAAGSLYLGDMRNVHDGGVQFVMDQFKKSYPKLFTQLNIRNRTKLNPVRRSKGNEEIVCEEFILGENIQ